MDKTHSSPAKRRVKHVLSNPADIPVGPDWLEWIAARKKILAVNCVGDSNGASDSEKP